MKRIAAAAATAVFFTAGYWSARLAWADRLYRTKGFARAAALAPWNSAYLAAADDLDGATRRNPRDAAAWIERALALETRGAIEEAERDLHQACRVSGQWNARWAMANFYARRENAASFWPWAAEAARVSFPSRNALLKLCGRMSSRPGEVFDRIVRPYPRLAPEFIRLALDEREPARAAPAAFLLIERRERDRLGLVLETCDALLAPATAAIARELWARLSAGGWVAHDAGLLSNGRFEAPILGKGFDWRIERAGGVWARQAAGGLTLEFSGDQPETCEVLAHYAALDPLSDYRLKWRPELPKGFAWRVSGGGGRPAAVSGSGEFRGQPVVRIALVYERPPGERRYQGKVNLVEVSLERASR